jgi:hypothetical protein
MDPASRVSGRTTGVLYPAGGRLLFWRRLLLLECDCCSLRRLSCRYCGRGSFREDSRGCEIALLGRPNSLDRREPLSGRW